MISWATCLRYMRFTRHFNVATWTEEPNNSRFFIPHSPALNCACHCISWTGSSWHFSRIRIDCEKCCGLPRKHVRRNQLTGELTKLQQAPTCLCSKQISSSHVMHFAPRSLPLPNSCHLPVLLFFQAPTISPVHLRISGLASKQQIELVPLQLQLRQLFIWQTSQHLLSRSWMNSGTPWHTWNLEISQGSKSTNMHDSRSCFPVLHDLACRVQILWQET